jgi:hypothetical protein
MKGSLLQQPAISSSQLKNSKKDQPQKATEKRDIGFAKIDLKKLYE